MSGMVPGPELTKLKSIRERRSAMRREFTQALLVGLRVVWPVISGLLTLILGLGIVAGILEGWSIAESIYFAFISGLTIGYGDFAPQTLTARVFAVVIGVCGILLTGLVVALAVRALNAVREDGATGP